MPADRKSSAKGERLAQRLAHILALLYEGADIDKHQLAQQFGVDVRTIERDLGERLGSIAHRDDQGTWQLTHSQGRTVPSGRLNDYADLVGTSALFPNPTLDFALEQLRLAPSERALRVLTPVSEDSRALRHAFESLQLAIRERHECSFDYKGKSRKVRPYKLIHDHGVWYLAGDEEGHVKAFSVAFISGLKVEDACRFQRSETHTSQIEASRSAWFASSTTEVLLRVSATAARFFLRRPVFPEQQHRADADGSLIVTTRIHHPLQLLPVVRYWSPHVRILRPASLHDAYIESLRQAMSGASASADAPFLSEGVV
ncbi:WYL domain-containing protein [Variovorax sp. KBS0712]|uniref:helix-turn-helix transcriptional regulator n=1 Tax=Variovorax sp. KBS0712 TaxID=2578111 RepID=UPI00111BBE6D|nr:WYL domain-containing protein [Variovorax sp. KBS0712]TSD56407.1 WYL domain-containing protein [Variovorax sp. KBS0712]